MFFMAGCVSTVKMDDQKLKPFAEMYRIDRDKFGMSPLPKEAEVSIENRHGKEDQGYDVMLHIYSKATHHVAFRLEGGRYEWVGEEETCEGPRKYKTADGVFKEQLDISNFHGVLHTFEGLHVSYRGPDEALRLEANIPIEKAKQLIAKWNCL
jgi:hypothetical protein